LSSGSSGRDLIRDLIHWYCANDATPASGSIDTDPILALRGVGKELLRELGDGEKFIH
jgi:hypothetical protein